MAVKKYRLLFLLFCLFASPYTLSPALCGWLIWQSPKIAQAPADETVRDVKETVKSLPEKAESQGGKISLPVNIIFVSTQEKIREALATAGWEESTSDILESAGSALMELSSGKKTVRFPPVRKFFLGNKPQDMSFAALSDSKEQLVIWRLPYKNGKGAPLWCAATNRASFSPRTGDKQEKEKELSSFITGLSKIPARRLKVKRYFLSRPPSKILVIELDG